MQIDAYLQRIGYGGPREPTAVTLRQLHRAHMLTVPFENLDIHLGHPIVLDLPALYDKLVRRRRGGFCYELNGLFSWLLAQLGFDVVMLAARVFSGTQPGPEFGHMLLRVALNDPLIADVGFGDSFLEPLRLNGRDESFQQGSVYRLVGTNPEKVLQRRRAAAWEPQYLFSLTPRRLDDYAPMCCYQQTSPESQFTQKSVCSLATPNGRITLSNNRLIITNDGHRAEQLINDDIEYRTVLHEHFGINLGADERIDQLLAPTPPE